MTLLRNSPGPRYCLRIPCIVTRLDRLARSTRDLFNVLDAVGKAGRDFALSPTVGLTPPPHGR